MRVHHRSITLTAAAWALAVGGLTTACLAADVLSPGFVKAEFFLDPAEASGGTTVDDLLYNNPNYPAQPDATMIRNSLSTPEGYGDNYGAQVTGFILPKETGEYRFFIRSDDSSRFFLNTTPNGPTPDPYVDSPIAEEAGCCNAFQEPDSFPLQTSEPVQLTAGQRYAFLAIVKEGGGGDYLYVAWRKEGDTTPAASLLTLAGPVIGANLPAEGYTIAVSQQPKAPPAPGVVEGRSYTLSGKATAAPDASLVYYQWQRDGVDIPGATGPNYTIPAGTAVGSYKYKFVAATVGDQKVTSDEVTVAVVPDTFPPAPTAGVLKRGNTLEVGIGFDEEVKPEAAAVQANYSVSAGSIASFQFIEQSGHAKLTLSGVAEGSTVTVTVKNVEDLKGNKIPASGASVDVKLASSFGWAAVGGNEANTRTGTSNYPDDAVALSEKDFDLVSGGSAYWDNYDEATFVYEEITGDFDRQVRVEYQDPTSQWARAGLQLREALDEGITRDQLFDYNDPEANPTGYKMSQNFTIRANPAAGAYDPNTDTTITGNNSYEQVHRPRAGYRYGGTGEGINAIYNIQGGFGGAPPYPNAWMRIQREGQTIRAWKSENGVDWGAPAEVTYADDPETDEDETLADKLYVGVFYAPEYFNNNIIPDGGPYILEGSSVAKFRDYGPAGAPAAPLTDGLVAYWSFDGNLLDSIKDFHGTGRGTTPPGFVDGKPGFGKAIKLDGSNQFVEITGGNEDELEFPGGSMSIAGWFRVDAFDTDWQALIAKGEGTNYRVARRAATGTIAYAGGVGEGADDVPAVNDGQWHHFVAVSDATAAEFGTALYVDGVRYGVNAAAPVLASNAQNLMIGENPEARNREWEGELDDIAIWNRVLSAADVSTLYNGGAGTPISTLPGVDTPVGEEPEVSISLDGTNVIIQWSPAGGTLETSPTLGPTATWTAVGTANPATIPIGAGAAYYRVSQ